MADRHKRPNRTIRLPEDLEKRLDKIAAERDLKFNAIVVAVLKAWVDGMNEHMPPAETAVTPQVRPYSKEQQAGKGRKR